MKIKSTQKIDLGMNIKGQIEKSGLRKVDLIRQMQLSGIEINKQRLYKLERGQANITADELLVMSKILECNIEEFFKEKN